MAITAMPVTRFVAGGDSESPGKSIGNAFGTGWPNVERLKSSTRYNRFWVLGSKRIRPPWATTQAIQNIQPLTFKQFFIL
jgi:hypothetical protein